MKGAYSKVRCRQDCLQDFVRQNCSCLLTVERQLLQNSTTESYTKDVIDECILPAAQEVVHRTEGTEVCSF